MFSVDFLSGVIIGVIIGAVLMVLVIHTNLKLFNALAPHITTDLKAATADVSKAAADVKAAAGKV
jgi:hypothetical protein